MSGFLFGTEAAFEITHSYPMNVIISFTEGFLLVTENTTSAIFKVQYKVIARYLKCIVIKKHHQFCALLFWVKIIAISIKYSVNMWFRVQLQRIEFICFLIADELTGDH